VCSKREARKRREKAGAKQAAILVQICVVFFYTPNKSPFIAPLSPLGGKINSN
jgi:hypothetical protein